METVLPILLAFALGLMLGPRLTPLRRWIRVPGALRRSPGSGTMDELVALRALAHARRRSEDGPLQLGALEIRCHPGDRGWLVDRLDALERSIRRTCASRRIEIRASRVLQAVVPDEHQAPGQPDVRRYTEPHGETRPYSGAGLNGTVPHSALPAAVPAREADIAPTHPHRIRLEPLGPGLRSLEVPSAGAVVGRDAGLCTLVIDTPTVSREHAILTPRPGRLAVQDSESANGIRINGVPTQAGSLVHGDVLGLGRSVRFQVVIGDE